jgi:Lipid A 3-O-deacylase (PagL)
MTTRWLVSLSSRKTRRCRYAIPSLQEALNLNFLEAEKVRRCILAHARRPKITFLQGDARVGMIISQTIGCSFYRGNFEILLDGFAAGITDGPGSWLAGGRVFGRYNFTQPGARIIPYLQVNGGALGNDIYRDHTQKIIGGGFEFTTGVSVGLRFLISRHFGLLLEGGYQHTSNGDIYLRNAGLNTLGAQAGLFYFF